MTLFNVSSMIHFWLFAYRYLTSFYTPHIYKDFFFISTLVNFFNMFVLFFFSLESNINFFFMFTHFLCCLRHTTIGVCLPNYAHESRRCLRFILIILWYDNNAYAVQKIIKIMRMSHHATYSRVFVLFPDILCNFIAARYSDLSKCKYWCNAWKWARFIIGLIKNVDDLAHPFLQLLFFSRLIGKVTTMVMIMMRTKLLLTTYN